MAEISINPGSGPVNGELSWENAYENIKQYIKDCEIPLYIAKSNHVPDEGRYLFVLRNDEYDFETEVEMPGLPLEKVRYVRAEGQNIFEFPRLYVDGGSWIWNCGITTKEQIAEMLSERIEEKKAEIERMKNALLKLKGEENGGI